MFPQYFQAKFPNEQAETSDKTNDGFFEFFESWCDNYFI